MKLITTVGLTLALVVSANSAHATVKCVNAVLTKEQFQAIKKAKAKGDEIKPKTPAPDLRIEIDPEIVLPPEVIFEPEPPKDATPTVKAVVVPKKTDLELVEQLDKLGRDIRQLTLEDPVGMEKADKMMEEYLVLTEKIAKLQESTGDTLHLMEYKWLVDQYVLKRNLKNGFHKQMYNKYRSKFRKVEWAYFKILPVRVEIQENVDRSQAIAAKIVGATMSKAELSAVVKNKKALEEKLTLRQNQLVEITEQLKNPELKEDARHDLNRLKNIVSSELKLGSRKLIEYSNNLAGKGLNEAAIENMKAEGLALNTKIMTLEKSIKGRLGLLTPSRLKTFANLFFEYREVRRYLEAVKTYGDPNSTPEQKASAKEVLGAFTNDIDANPSIISMTKEIERGLHVNTVKSGIPFDQLTSDVFSLENMEALFDLPEFNNMNTFLHKALWYQRYDTYMKRVIDKNFRDGLANFAKRLPQHSKFAKFIKFMSSFDETALMQREFLQDVSEVLSSKGTVEDKMELLAEKSAMDKSQDRIEFQTFLFLHSSGFIAKRTQLVQIQPTVLGKDPVSVVMQRSDKPLDPIEAKEPYFKDVYNSLKAKVRNSTDLVLKGSDETYVPIESRTMKANDFLVYMYRLVHTRNDWVAIRTYLERQTDKKSQDRLAAMKTAELVGGEMGEIAVSNGKPVVLWRIATLAVASALASPVAGDMVYQGLTWLMNHTPYISIPSF